MLKRVKIAKIVSVGKRRCFDLDCTPFNNLLAKKEGSEKGFLVHNSKGISNLCRTLGIDSFDDIINANGMYRPGPLGAGYDKLYAENKKKPHSINHVHHTVADITEDTFGLILYQEQVMQVFSNLAGFPKDETEVIRKLIAKSKGEEEIKAYKERFVEGAVANGLKKEQAEELLEQLCSFGGYSFNKSHCVAYSMLAFKTAWLKVFYPHEFYTSLLQRTSDEGKLNELFHDMRRRGVKVLPPSINSSKKNFNLESRKKPKKKVKTRGQEKYLGIRCGMIKVKFVGDAMCDSIIENQPFKSLEDFLCNVP